MYAEIVKHVMAVDMESSIARDLNEQQGDIRSKSIKTNPFTECNDCDTTFKAARQLKFANDSVATTHCH